MNTKLVRKYTSSHLAFIHKGVLEENGIDGFVFGENFMNTFPAMYGVLGSGVELRVRTEDYEKALKILEPENAVPDCCANCGSQNIVFGYGKNGISKILFALLSAFVWEPFGNIKRQYYCKECGFKSN